MTSKAGLRKTRRSRSRGHPAFPSREVIRDANPISSPSARMQGYCATGGKLHSAGRQAAGNTVSVPNLSCLGDNGSVGSSPVLRRGMTLLELTLALCLVVIVASIGTVAVGRRHERREFVENVERFETMLRMARAQAAIEGRRFQIAFEPREEGSASSVPRVLWEPDPLTEPGQFAAHSDSTWSGYVPGEEVRILACRLVGPSAYRDLAIRGDDTSEDEQTPKSLLFYPDGSSDSALVELAPVDESDELRATVRLDGVNGITQVWIITETELEENREDIEQGVYDPDAEAETDLEAE